MRIIISGGTGLLGRALTASLLADGHEVIALSRSPQQASGLPQGLRTERWDARSGEGWAQLAEGAGAIVNLAGENIGAGRWTAERKQRILNSRINAGQAVVDAVQQATVKPGVVVQISGVGYYGPHGSEELTEQDEPGSDWMAGVAREWEAASAPVEALGVRRVVMRTGPVLSREGGALPLMTLPFRFYTGGPLGSGRQWLSWVHIADQVAALRFLMDNPEASGVYNVTAPYPVTYAMFARAAGRVLRRPAWLRVPALPVRLALGEMSTVVLDGQRVLPRRLLDMGFNFRFPVVEAALTDLYRH